MPRFRLLNCDFLNDSSFLNDRTNKAKLLYVLMCLNADDVGFVGNTKNILQSLADNEHENGTISLQLLNNDYNSALLELLTNGYLYEFKNKYGNSTYLIRHWFLHNKWKQGLRTNYPKYRNMVELSNYEYVFKKESSKENNTNQSNVKQSKPNQTTDDYAWNELVADLEGENDGTTEDS